MGRPAAVTKEQFLKALVDNKYKMTDVAKQLGVSRGAAYSYLQRYNVKIIRKITIKEDK